MQQAAEFFKKLRLFFSFERIFIVIFLLTVLLRFWQLDLKLFHHDEAIHSWFSYELLKTGAWVYDPSYHGPFLYYVTAGMFYLFGDSDLTARLLPSLFGTLLIPLVYFIYRIGYLDKKQSLSGEFWLSACYFHQKIISFVLPEWRYTSRRQSLYPYPLRQTCPVAGAP